MVLKYKKYTEIDENVKKKLKKHSQVVNYCLEFEILSTFYLVLYAIPVKMLSELIQLNQLCIQFRMENILTAKATAMENKTQGLTFLLLDL